MFVGNVGGFGAAGFANGSTFACWVGGFGAGLANGRTFVCWVGAALNAFGAFQERFCWFWFAVANGLAAAGAFGAKGFVAAALAAALPFAYLAKGFGCVGWAAGVGVQVAGGVCHCCAAGE